MGNLFDKRTVSGSNAPKDKKAAKELRRENESAEKIKERRKTKIITISVLSVLIIAFLGAVTLNSNFIRREVSVVTIDGVGFSAAEFDYLYISNYLEYRWLVEQQMPAELIPMLLPSRDIPLSEQINASTGESWQDFFVDRTIASMSDMVIRYNLAMADGFVMPDDVRLEMETEIDSMRMSAQFGNFDTFDSFLRQHFGPAINESIYLRIVEMMYIASAYEQSMIPDFEFSEEELDDFYFENRDAFDNYTIRLITIRAEADPDAEDQAIALGEALVEAIALAEGMVLDIETEDDFIAQALAFDPVLHLEPDSTLQDFQGEHFPSVISDWVSNADRQYGDVAALTDEMSIAYVVYFVERNDNSYLLTSFRQLLFLRQDSANPVNPGDFADEESFLAEMDRLDAEANALANEFFQLFIEYGADEAALDQIVLEHEDLDIDGDLYSNIARAHVQAAHEGGISTMRVVPEIEEWLFDPVRQIGDYELIRTEAFGYHLVFFTGFGERFSLVFAENRLVERERLAAHEAWLETLPTANVNISGLFSILIGIGGFM